MPGDDIDFGTRGSGTEDISDVVEIYARVTGATGGGSTSKDVAEMEAVLQADTFSDLHFYVGGSGSQGSSGGGFNGGGDASGDGYGGGGSSDIRLGSDSVSNRVLVAGASGGDAYNSETGSDIPGGSGGTDKGGSSEKYDGTVHLEGGESPNDFSSPSGDDEYEAGGASIGNSGGGGGGYYTGFSGVTNDPNGNGGGGGSGGASYYDEGLLVNNLNRTTVSPTGLSDGSVEVTYRLQREAPEIDSPSNNDIFYKGESISFTSSTPSLADGYYSKDFREWDLDDGSTRLGDDVSYSYDSTGLFTVSVKDIDTQGYDGNVSTVDVEIQNAADPDFIVPSNIIPANTVTFEDNSSVNSLDEWRWKVDGAIEDSGTSSTPSDFSYSFSSPGTYNVSLEIEAFGVVYTESKNVTVEDAVKPDFTYSTPVTQGFDVSFTDSSTIESGATVEQEYWNVEGSKVSESTDLTYNFGSPGEFIVEKVFVADGITYKKQYVVNVEPAADVSFSYDGQVITDIEEVFTDQTTIVDGANRTDELWVINSQEVSTSKDLSYTFNTAGDYTIGKIVTVNGYDYSQGEIVTVEQNTTADYSYTPSKPLNGDSVSFTDQSVTPFTITSYSWDFGDGSTSTSQNPSHTFTDRGEYNVSLTVEDDQGQSDTYSEIVSVFSKKPTVETSGSSSVGDFSATLEGLLVDLGVDSTADVYFEYREAGSSTWNQTAVQTLSDTGSFSETVEGLSIETDYEFRSVGENSEGVLQGDILTFSTNDNTPPSINAINLDPIPLVRNTATSVQVQGSDQVGISELQVKWIYDGVEQTSQTLSYSSVENLDETVTDLYSPSQFGSHTVEVTLTDDFGLSSTVDVSRSLNPDEPEINLLGPNDGATLGYSESFSYDFDLVTGNAEVTSVTLSVIDANSNVDQENSLGSLAVDSSNSYSVSATQVENPGDYTWNVDLEYETNNSLSSGTRSLTVSEPSDVSVETGNIVSGGYGLGGYGDKGYGDDFDAIGFNYFNTEGGVLFEGNSSQLQLYFQYRKKGENAWIETDRENYDTGN